MSEPTQPIGLYKKLLAVMGAIEGVDKNGKNEFHRYDYATEADVSRAVRKELLAQGVIATFTVLNHQRTDKGTKGDMVTDMLIRFSFIDSETGQVLSSDVQGSGEDKGDKGSYKALTGAMKYWLMKTFLIPTGDDPERDEHKGEGYSAPVPQRQGYSAPQERQQSFTPKEDLQQEASWSAKSGKKEDPENPVFEEEQISEPVMAKTGDCLFVKGMQGRNFWCRDKKLWDMLTEVAKSNGLVDLACRPPKGTGKSYQVVSATYVEQ